MRPGDDVPIVTPPAVARELRALRLERGYGLRELGRRIGCSHSFLSTIEHGKRAPSMRVADGLIMVLQPPPRLAWQLDALAADVEREGPLRLERHRARAALREAERATRRL